MSWIKMRTDLARDPAVASIAAECGIPASQVVGCLHAVWSWFDEQTEDGVIRIRVQEQRFSNACVTLALLQERTGVAEFARAMQNSGWLVVSQEGDFEVLTIPRWDRHNSQSAKRRALTALRVERYRIRQRNATVTPDALPEQSREEKNSVDSAQRKSLRDSKNHATLPLHCAAPKKSAGAAGGNGKAGAVVTAEIVCLLGDRGCDESFRQIVAASGNIRLVRQLAARFDRERRRIRNAGGWWRQELRRAGMEGV